MAGHDRAGAYQWMDASRAVAASVVVLGHLRDLLLQNYEQSGPEGLGEGGTDQPLITALYALSGFGHAAVITFFVLSGFWITRSVVRRAAAPDFWTVYLIDRLTRLWVVLVPVLVIGALLDLFGFHVLEAPVLWGATGSTAVPPTALSSLGVWPFFANLFFLQALASPVFGTNSPLWSVAFEFWYYVWFPALWLAVRYRRWSLALLSLPLGLLNPEMYLGFVSWLVGSLLYLLVEHVDWHRWDRRARLVLTLSGALACGATLMIARTRVGLWFDPILAIGFGWLLLGLCLLDPAPSRLLAPIARYGASTSFSLYALHFPIAVMAAALLAPSERWAPTLGGFGFVVAIFIELLGISWLFSLATERQTPLIRQLARGRLIRASWSVSR